jgi:hypothetical protein
MLASTFSARSLMAEGVGGDDVFALGGRHAEPEQPGLAEVVVEGRRRVAHLAGGGDLDRYLDVRPGVLAG